MLWMAQRQEMREAFEREAARREAKRKQNKRKGRAGRPKPNPEAPLVARDPALPLWTPAGIELSRVPAEVQQAAREIVQPVCEQFVLHAADGLEKSLGATIAHLLWLEILEQFDMKREYVNIDSVLNLPGNRQDVIAQHLRLIEAKVRVGYFLVRIRELRQRAAAVRQAELQGGGQLHLSEGQLQIAAASAQVMRPEPNGSNGSNESNGIQETQSSPASPASPASHDSHRNPAS
jgi:hypothetical protein